MKRKILLLIQPILICCLATCAVADKEDWQEMVPGVYATSYEQLYSTGQDTLYIEKEGHQKDLYQITRHTAYQRKLNDSITTVIQKSKTYLATAEGSRQTLRVHPSGRRYWFDKEPETIHAGEVIYKKIQ